jgi:5S rRNA maturation endonuclease (ribonuclease M5)
LLTPEERLELLEKALEELGELSTDVPIVVEGARDIAALKRLGVAKNVLALNTGKSVFAFCEDLSRRSSKAIILTDWDRRGGQLARRLKEGFESNDVKVNDRIRTQIVVLSKKEVKDIESLPTFIERLRSMAVSQRS